MNALDELMMSQLGPIQTMIGADQVFHDAPVHLPNAEEHTQAADPAPQAMPAPQVMAAQDAGTTLDAAPSPAPDAQHVEAVMEDAQVAGGDSPRSPTTTKKTAKPSHK